MELSSSNKHQQRRVGTGRIIGSARFEPYRRPAARRFFRLDGGADDDEGQHDAPGPIRHRRRPINRRPHVINPYRVDDLTTEQLLERHVSIIDNYVQHVQKFNVDGYQTRFVLRDLDEADNPVRVLERVMDHLMGIAKDNSAEAGYEVTHIGIAFTVEGMQSDFLIPFRPPAENNAEKVSTAIDEKDQSDKEDSVTVYDKEMTLLITTVKDIRGAGRSAFVDDEAECSDSDDEDDDEDDDDDEDTPELTDFNDDAPRPSRRIRRQQERAAAAAKKQRGRKKLMYVPGKSIIENALIRIPDDDTRCLFFALVISRHYNVAMQDEEKKNAGKTRTQIASAAHHKTQRLLKNRQRLLEEAIDLMEAARIPQGQPDYGTKDAKKVQEYFDKSWPGLFRIVIFGERSGTKAIFNGDVNAKFNLCLYHNEAHFDVIKSPAQFFDRKFYCIDCEMPFSHKNTHTMHCRIKCLRCLRMGHGFPCPKKDGETIECPDCRLIFNNLNCYEHHKRSACKEYKRCLDCGIVYRPYRLVKHGGHRCGTSYCHTCASYHPSYEPCFIPPLEFIKTKKEEKKTLKKKKWNCYVDEEGEEPRRYVAFDFESEIHEKITTVKERHAPNYASMHITCSKCIAEGVWEDFEKTDCECCGPQKVYSFAAWELPEGKTVVDAMLDVLLADLPKDFKTYAYAHNGAKYDTPFIMQALAKRGGTMPKVTQRGNKVIEVRIQKTRNFNALTIRDSVMLFPMKLADCPETFDLRRNGELIMAKTFFPYRYNRAENYGVRRNGLPPMADYIPEKMTKKEKREFQAWYVAHQNDAFDLCAELGEYCSNDSLILLYALVSFRETFNALANGADIFSMSCTITSACLRLFRYKFLKKKTLAVVPNHGYLSGSMQSTKALFFFKWFADAHNVRVQHRDTDEGEMTVARDWPGAVWHVDAHIPLVERLKPDFKRCDLPDCPYCNDPETLQKDTIIEFLGCAWHGCPECYPNDVTLPNGRKSDEEWQQTSNRLHEIERLTGAKVIPIQECRFDVNITDSMRAFNNQFHDTGPLNPRDAFFGGRVHPTRMYSPPSDTKKKCHKDIVSLYPSVLKKEYPVAHPKVHHCDWKEGAVNWTKPEDVTINGLIKCIVSPPKRLFLPVLPFRDDNRLLFPLCRTCARESRNQCAFGLKQCNHTPEEREFVTSVTHFELQEALRRGYVVTRVIETWDYEKMDDTIFAGYINEFMKIKVEASGWEKNGVDEMDDEAKQAFVDAYATQGIFIEKDKVAFNPGLRYIAKLCLNSLWGRFAMRPDQDQVELVTKPTRMYKLLDDPTREVMSIIAINDDVLRITWRYKKRHEKPDFNSNIVVGIFTTSYGRCELYKHMCAVDERMDGPLGSMLNYNDTDSVNYDYDYDPRLPNGGDPLREGFFLGEMTDEHPKEDILEYCSGGNKQYGMKLRNKQTGVVTHKQKIRGITLNDVNANLLPYEKFREMTLAAPRGEPVRMPNPLIMRDKQYNVFTLNSFKNYLPIWRKGNVDLRCERRTIYPPGYVFTPEELS